tara:strand:- start:19 stop:2628 length:2610 start_codon:yes stop_codon:yes gene_type:complete
MANETTVSQSTATRGGVTFTFDASYEVGTFSLTDPDEVHIFVVHSTGLSITGDTPDSVSLNGGIKNGIMKNPYMSFAGGQGFDEFIGAGGASYISSANIAYSSGLNIAPSITSSNIVVASGEEATFVKAIRLASVTDADQWQTIEKYVYLHVLTTTPLLGSYPPSASGTTKTMWTRTDVDYTVLRNLTFPASFTESAATLATKLPSSLGTFGLGGEYLRRLRLDVALGTTTSNYSAQIADGYAKALMALHETGIVTADRDEIVDKAIQFGVQIYGIIERGGSGLSAGAGQGGGIGEWLYYSGALLGDSTMWTSAKDLVTQTVSSEWLNTVDIGRAAGGKSGKNAQTVLTEHAGVPFVIPDEFGTNHDTRYGSLAAFIVAYENLAIWMLQNTPDASNGAVAILNGATANNTAQPRAANAAFLDRYRTWTPWVGGNDPGTIWRDMYDLVQPLMGLAAWTGQPDQVQGEESNFTAGDGTILWNVGTYDFATETVSSIDMRYSVDNVQFVEVTGVAASSSQAGLLKGAPHWAGLRRVSASGNGAWGLNYPRDTPITSEIDRNKVTTTGTTTAAIPSNTTAPVIHARFVPAWGYKLWTPLSGTIDVNDTELAAGVGYWSGYPAPTYTYQWKRDTVDISGETNQTYNRAAADAETDITCVVTATNASGAVSATTDIVTAPAIQSPPSGTLIDTNFRGAFPVDYATEWGNVTSSAGATPTLLPTETFSSFEALEGLTINYGTFQLDKISSYPNGLMPLSRSLVAGKTYQLDMQFVFVGDWTGTFYYDFRRVANSVSYLDAGQYTQAVDAAAVLNVVETFTVGSSESNLAPELQFGHTTATGGTAGGDPYLTQMSLSEVVGATVTLSNSASNALLIA